MASTHTLNHDDYTITLICPLPVEQAPIEALLDEIHPDLPIKTMDKNSYTFGHMHTYDVVVASMPRIRNTSAASVATQVLNNFPCLQFSLLIRIGGGLGDVVVSKPKCMFGGIVQFQQGKALAGRKFERTGHFRAPPDVLLTAAGRLEALHQQVDSTILRFLAAMLEKYPKAGLEHAEGYRDCKRCSLTGVIEPEDWVSLDPVIHYGTIGLSDIVVKDGVLQDMVRDDLGVIYIEMEAAGLIDIFPGLVIQGISNYADLHKNNTWQPYAAAVAAAYVKELLSYILLLNNLHRDRAYSSYTILCVRNTRNFVNRNISGDLIAGDKVSSNRISGGFASRAGEAETAATALFRISSY
ncbi:purine and uridine phosphorylase [Aspergillus tetrazonus]